MDGQKIISLCGACAITVTGFALSSPAFAEPITVIATRDEDRVTKRVSYRDLNLAVARDEQRLVRRVGFAVSSVCPSEIAYIQIVRNCRTSAWDGARPQIALAVERAKQIASSGYSSIAPVAIVIAAPQ